MDKLKRLKRISWFLWILVIVLVILTVLPFLQQWQRDRLVNRAREQAIAFVKNLRPNAATRVLLKDVILVKETKPWRKILIFEHKGKTARFIIPSVLVSAFPPVAWGQINYQKGEQYLVFVKGYSLGSDGKIYNVLPKEDWREFIEFFPAKDLNLEPKEYNQNYLESEGWHLSP